MIKPTQDRILLKEIEREKETESGIIVPSDEALSGEFYEVVDVGPFIQHQKEQEEEFIGLDIKIGDVVVVGDFMVEEVEEADESYAIVERDDILAVKRDD